jgi:hypothetical protein
MENYYTAYSKELQGKIFYFVKWHIKFSELKNVPPLLKGYGMHTDFNKACRIACIDNDRIKEQLLQEIEVNVQRAKVIELNNDIIVKRKTNVGS